MTATRQDIKKKLDNLALIKNDVMGIVSLIKKARNDNPHESLFTALKDYTQEATALIDNLTQDKALVFAKEPSLIEYAKGFKEIEKAYSEHYRKLTPVEFSGRYGILNFFFANDPEFKFTINEPTLTPEQPADRPALPSQASKPKLDLRQRSRTVVGIMPPKGEEEQRIERAHAIAQEAEKPYLKDFNAWLEKKWQAEQPKQPAEKTAVDTTELETMLQKRLKSSAKPAEAEKSPSALRARSKTTFVSSASTLSEKINSAPQQETAKSTRHQRSGSLMEGREQPTTSNFAAIRAQFQSQGHAPSRLTEEQLKQKLGKGEATTQPANRSGYLTGLLGKLKKPQEISTPQNFSKQTEFNDAEKLKVKDDILKQHKLVKLSQESQKPGEKSAWKLPPATPKQSSPEQEVKPKFGK